MTRTLALARRVCSRSACRAGAAPPRCRWSEDGDHAVTLVTEDVSTPTAMAFIGPDDFLVLEKNTGRVQRFAGGVRTQVLDLHVNRDGERGLLGIAVHPDFAAAVDPKPWVYLYYTASARPRTSTTARSSRPTRSIASRGTGRIWSAPDCPS